MGMLEDYKKYAGKIHTEVKFTLFDKEFLIEAYNHQKELERQIAALREHIIELDKIIKSKEE